MSRRAHVRSLICSLLAEASQAEESAASHAGREADRLGSAPPGLSMRAVAQHARHVRSGLLSFVRTRGDGEVVLVSTRFGRLLADVRALGVDMMISSEKSYRGTLLGLHHAIGVFLLLEDAAAASGDQELAEFCSAWLAERTRLVANAEHDLAWFAENPERALGRALPPFVKRLQRAVPLPEVLRERAGPIG